MITQLHFHVNIFVSYVTRGTQKISCPVAAAPPGDEASDQVTSIHNLLDLAWTFTFKIWSSLTHSKALQAKLQRIRMHAAASCISVF